MHDPVASLRAPADEKNFAPVIAFIGTDTVEMQHRAGGIHSAMRDFIYTGTSDDFAIERWREALSRGSKAAAYVAKWYLTDRQTDAADAGVT